MGRSPNEILKVTYLVMLKSRGALSSKRYYMNPFSHLTLKSLSTPKLMSDSGIVRIAL